MGDRRFSRWRWPLTWALAVYNEVGYRVRPFDQVSWRRRWFWQPEATTDQVGGGQQ